MTKDELLQQKVKDYLSFNPTEGSRDFVVYKVKVGENAFAYVVENKNELSSSDWVKMYEGTERECYRAVGYLDVMEKVSYLEDNLRVARKDRENLQLEVARGLKEFVHDYPATALRFLANENYVERYDKAEDLLKWFVWYFIEGSPNLVPYKHKVKEAEVFLNGEACPDCFCEDCPKEDCDIKKLGLVEVKK